VDGEEMRAGGVNTRNDEVGANVALVAEQMLLQHGHAGDDAGLAAGGEGVQFEVGGDDGSGKLGVGGGTGTSAPNLRGDVVELLAVLGYVRPSAMVIVVSMAGTSLPCLLQWDHW
jgi:hypothetical protein